MGLEVALGMGLMAAGGAYGAYEQGAANRRNTRAQQNALNQRNAMGQSLMLGEGADAETQRALQQWLGSLGSPATYGAPTLQAAQVDLAGLLQGLPQFNVGQDSLLQAMRADPTVQMDSATAARLGGIAASGQPFDTTAQFAALQAQDRDRAREVSRQVRGSAGSVGERLGSARFRAESDAQSQLANDAAARNAQIAQAAYEAAQGRRMTAEQLLQQGQQFAVGATQANRAQALQAAGLFNQFQQGTLAQQLQAALANATSTNQTNQFNVGSGFNAAQFNAGQRQQQALMQLQGIQQLQNLVNQRRQYNAGIYGVMAGQPLAAQSQAGPWGGAISDFGSLLFMLPFLRGMSPNGGTFAMPGGGTYGGPVR